MRKQAFILILPFAVFITETVSIVPVMQNACIIVAEKEPTCCVVTESDELECAPTGEGEQSPEDCTDNPDCSTCPVCYTFICPATYELTAHHFMLKKNYASIKTSYNSSYTCSVWKPPNVLTISA